VFYHCDVPTIILFDFLYCHASFNSFQTPRNINPRSVPPIPPSPSLPPNRTTSLAESYEESDIATVSYLSIFARTILSVPNILTDVLEALITSTGLCKVFGISSESSAADKTKAHQSLFAMLVRLMIEKFDSVAYCTAGAWRRKLW
jgi:hypothetical protein